VRLLVRTDTETPTHLITQAREAEGGILPARTLKYFTGIVAGIWVLSFDWVLACVKAGTVFVPLSVFLYIYMSMFLSVCLYVYLSLISHHYPPLSRTMLTPM
jgi:hypothetical protein